MMSQFYLSNPCEYFRAVFFTTEPDTWLHAKVYSQFTRVADGLTYGRNMISIVEPIITLAKNPVTSLR